MQPWGKTPLSETLLLSLAHSTAKKETAAFFSHRVSMRTRDRTSIVQTAWQKLRAHRQSPPGLVSFSAAHTPRERKLVGDKTGKNDGRAFDQTSGHKWQGLRVVVVSKYCLDWRGPLFITSHAQQSFHSLTGLRIKVGECLFRVSEQKCWGSS